MTRYDAVVIGCGTGGESVLWELNGAGRKVAAIDQELVGGTCAYWGCMPSKTLLRPGTIEWEARHAAGTQEPALEEPQIFKYRNYITRDWDDAAQAEKLTQAGMDFFRGHATIPGPGTVQVDGRTLEAEHIVIATGSEPSIPPIPGLKDVQYWTNREATSFSEVPKSALVIGGGAIGAELGQALHTFGSQVTIIEAAPQLLGRENPHAAGHLQKRFEAIGITLRLGCKTAKVEESADGKTIILDNGERLTAEVVLVATGRHARTEGLGLETFGVKPTRQGIPVDEHCRAAPNIWAVGDVTGVAGFTHIADYQGRIVAANILGQERTANYGDIPAVTFTDPEVASVGIANPDHAPDGMEIAQAEVDLYEVSRTVTYGKDLHGGLCLFADRRARVLVGAWAVGPLAGEWIQFATLAIRARVPIDVLDDTILAFPTFTRGYLQPLHQLRKELS